MAQLKRLVLALSLALALSIGVLSTTASPAQAMPNPATPAHWQYNYRADFKTKASCNRWGNWAENNIPFVDDHWCHKPWHASRWRIDLHWRAIPGNGGGGGGGGSGSWSAGLRLLSMRGL